MKTFPFFFLWSLIFSQLNLDFKESFVSYEGSHPLHDWKAISNEIILETDCNKNSTHCQLNFKIPIITFNSGNDNRDSNALMLVDGLTFPKVELNVKNFNMNSFLTGELNTVISSLNLNGHSKIQEIPLNLELNGSSFIIKSSFEVSLASFNIKRPSLLFLPISDIILINTHLNGAFYE